MRTRKQILLFLAVILLSGCSLADKGSSRTPGTPDGFEKRMDLWQAPAGNRPGSKMLEMDIDMEQNWKDASAAYQSCLESNGYQDAERIYDTFTCRAVLDSGTESKAFDDRPSLIPYYAEGGGDRAVIIVPGGGFGTKSIVTSDDEGKDLAKMLNQHGIHAFVLYYRSNPYEYPIPVLDLQRAVRFVRFQCEYIGFDPEKIDLIGFGTGAFLVADYINRVQGETLFPEDYSPDYMDEMSDTVEGAAMISPVFDFEEHESILFGLHDAETVRSEAEREKLLALHDLTLQIRTSVPQLLVYGSEDSFYPPMRSAAYAEQASRAGNEVTITVVEGQGAKLKQESYAEDLLNWLKH